MDVFRPDALHTRLEAFRHGTQAVADILTSGELREAGERVAADGWIDALGAAREERLERAGRNHHVLVVAVDRERRQQLDRRLFHGLRFRVREVDERHELLALDAARRSLDVDRRDRRVERLRGELLCAQPSGGFGFRCGGRVLLHLLPQFELEVGEAGFDLFCLFGGVDLDGGHGKLVELHEDERSVQVVGRF